ncbi:MAG TPA: hypothetical protein VK175_03645 [Leadbetterella sp.]|nr:hypothetical protein [Leadbetterella sp.]
MVPKGAKISNFILKQFTLISPKINANTLSDYYESLKILLKDYLINQKQSTI